MKSPDIPGRLNELLCEAVVERAWGDGFSDVAVHTRGEAAFAVAWDGAGGHGDDGDVLLALGLGFTADVASDGLEALQAITRRPNAAVLMDCQMPVMDGYTATQQIRHNEV